MQMTTSQSNNSESQVMDQKEHTCCKLHILISRCGVEMNAPRVFLSYDKAYEAMARSYNNSLQEYDSDVECCIDGTSAAIMGSGDWEEWELHEILLDCNHKSL